MSPQTSLLVLLLATVPGARVESVRGAAQADAKVDAQAAATRVFDLRPLGARALWFEARAAAETAEAGEADRAEHELVRALRALEDAGLGPWLLALDARVLAAGDVAGVAAAFEGLPEQVVLRGSDDPVPLRSPALAAARHLLAAARHPAEAAPDGDADADGRSESGAAQAWADLAAALAPSGGLEACLAHAAERLALPWDRGQPLVLHLVPRAPWPGALTARTTAGPVSLVGRGGLGPGALAEVVVHEALHQLEARAAAPGSVHAGLPARLDSELAALGLGPRDARRRDAVHALLFLAAGEAVRALHDPEHVDHGDAAGTYGRLAVPLEVLRDAFGRLASGELDADAFVGSVADELAD